MSRYIIGIDLGTTNCAVAYLDTDRKKNPFLAVQLFKILQKTSDGMVQSYETLPSFCYLEENGESVGVFAREEGARIPSKRIASAKSWLCHGAVDRKEKILPLEAGTEGRKLSPVEVTTCYLNHIRISWNSQIAKGDFEKELEQQEIILTVPASFDEMARRLTLEAAKHAGFGSLTLLEEPQAAFYHWLDRKFNRCPFKLEEGQTILVCDIGGGTTDFSLIEIRQGKEGKLVFQRESVGNHLLLGGDNIDRALAYWIEPKFSKTLSGEQWSMLVEKSRELKEKLLNQAPIADTLSITLQGIGSKIIGGGCTATVDGKELRDRVLDGFCPVLDFDEAKKVKKKSGLQSMGLPYEVDPAFSKHLAEFLSNSQTGQPNYLLFNGGTTKSKSFQERILQNLQRWFGGQTERLSCENLDFAVAKGAAYFGKSKRGLGIRVQSGSARAYYLGIESESNKATMLTLLERGAEEGRLNRLDRIFFLQPNQPVSFQLYSSNTRLGDSTGGLITLKSEEMQQLPPLYTVIQFGKKSSEKLPVSIQVAFTEMGLLEIVLISQITNHKWKLEFQVRGQQGEEENLKELESTREDVILDEQKIRSVGSKITQIFSKDYTIQPLQCVSAIEQELGVLKQQWSVSMLRQLVDQLLKQESGRKVSPQHESRWWNLLGYCMRPGFGTPLDDHRMKIIWSLILESHQNVSSDIQLQQWICWRRIAGGFSRGQQQQLWSLLQGLFLSKKGEITIKGKKSIYAYTEQIRCLGSMERVELKWKEKLGEALIQRVIAKDAIAAEYWCIARLGARDLMHGTIAHCLPAKRVQKWVDRLCIKGVFHEELPFILSQFAIKTGNREVDLSAETMQKIEEKFQTMKGGTTLQELLKVRHQQSQFTEEKILGDSLPPGLALVKR